MTRTSHDSGHDVVAVGNAIVDVIASATDADLAAAGLVKGGMRLVEAAEAERLYASMGPAVEVSGGSAANTAVGVASLGGRAGFVGLVADDQLGRVFTHDIRAAGVTYEVSPTADGGPGTARCLVLVTPDAQRTLNTYLGTAGLLEPGHVDPDLVGGAAVTFVEGYLWDPPPARAAVARAAEVARGAGRRVALTLSDAGVVERHRADLLGFLASVDVLFANENEARALFEADDLESAVRAAGEACPLVAVTMGEHGSVVVEDGAVTEVAVERVGEVVDTTGAGDLYAAGFLHALAAGRPVAECGRLGSLCAAEVIAHVGARPARSLAALAAERGL